MYYLIEVVVVVEVVIVVQTIYNIPLVLLDSQPWSVLDQLESGIIKFY